MLRLIVVSGVALSLAACATPSRFEWGNYENALYVYSKKPEGRENYRKALIAAIDRGEQTKRLAPGLHAELGYLFLEDGNIPEAKSHFEKEMAAFPESRKFLGGVTTRIGGGSAASVAPADASGQSASR